jgi:hypothetical protein
MSNGTALSTAQPTQMTTSAVWTPSFATRVDEAIQMKQEKKRFFEGVMDVDVHYGVIPGTGTKPTLFKSGAEMLLSNMGLNCSFEDEGAPIIDITGKDHDGEAFIYYRRECRIYRQTGPKEDDRMVVGKASGVCNSWETKYRYRNAGLTCPTCGKETIKASKFSDGKPFYCHQKMGGCGAQFEKSVFAGIVLGKIANPDIADLMNTILKMADKRALVAATLVATGCSDIFTQDVEDMSSDSGYDYEHAPAERKNEQRPAQQQRNNGKIHQPIENTRREQNQEPQDSIKQKLASTVKQVYVALGVDPQSKDKSAHTFAMATVSAALGLTANPQLWSEFTVEQLKQFLALENATNQENSASRCPVCSNTDGTHRDGCPEGDAPYEEAAA